MKFIISALTAIAICTMVATAAEEKKGGDKPKFDAEAAFKKMDTNGDGKLSLEEFKAKAKDATKAEATFKAKDKDGDGFLSLEEFKAHGKRHEKGDKK
jgi:Ca2+-binding EF-hand superfamily protein